MTDLRCAILALTLVLAGPACAQNSKLDRMTAKLKKDCEDQGGEFKLTASAATYTANALDAPVAGRPGEHGSGSALSGLTPGGKTALAASGECVWSFHTDAVTLPPSDAPKEILHLDPNGADKP